MALMISAYVLGAMLGAVGFMLSSLKNLMRPNETNNPLAGEEKEKNVFFKKIADCIWGPKELADGTSVSEAYDKIQCYLPRAAGRLAKLRSESHLSRVLFVGSVILSFVALAAADKLVNKPFTFMLLGAICISSICFWHHIKSRTGHLLKNNWEICKEIIEHHPGMPEQK
ncbi:MAG: hypothetical protein JW863_12850 [Chitinispirillaceae bacterium]|nr:hypothetical protein [Chitinispirillaceae bacterium]